MTSDRPAWFDRQLVDYLPYITSKCLRYRLGPQLTDDMVQETCRLAMHRWENFRTYPDKPTTYRFVLWLNYVILDAVGKYLRKKGSYTFCTFLEDHDMTPPEAAHQPQQELSLELSMALEGVPAQNLEMLSLLSMGHEINEVARIMGKHRHTVRINVQKSRDSIAAHIGAAA